MTDTTRRGVLRTAAIAAAGVTLMGLAAGPAQARPAATATSCGMETLPAPADTYRSDTAGIDPSGRYIVGSAIVRQSTDSNPMLLWDRGQLTQFDAPLPNAGPVDVNRRGVVIGNGRVGTLRRPWRYHAGTATVLPVPNPADEVLVEGINSRGDIVGIGYTPAHTTYALLWPASRPGTVRVLDTPAEVTEIAGITDNGAVVGVSGGPHEPTSWLRTRAGAVRILASPDGTGATAIAIGRRWAVGQGFNAGALVALRWDLRTGLATVLDPRLGVPADVNASGVVLSGDQLQRGSTVATLPSPSPSQPVGGRAIADNGTVVGFHNNRLPGGVRGVRWTGC